MFGQTGLSAPLHVGSDRQWGKQQKVMGHGAGYGRLEMEGGGRSHRFDSHKLTCVLSFSFSFVHLFMFHISYLRLHISYFIFLKYIRHEQCGFDQEDI
jgi:hypothetical protein